MFEARAQERLRLVLSTRRRAVGRRQVSKLLIAMERGEVKSLIGRNLDDIDINVEGKNFLLLIVMHLLT
jgi:hypothetical protein